MLFNNDYRSDASMRAVYDRTNILRKPICGIVSGYHDLPYVMVAPSAPEGGKERTAEITGRINVSPKFIFTAEALNETFGDVFDADTFDTAIEGRVFSFAYAGNRNVKVESRHFSLRYFDESPKSRAERVLDEMMMREDTRTGLIYGPDLRYYPVSVDKFITEIVDREFRV